MRFSATIVALCASAHGAFAQASGGGEVDRFPDFDPSAVSPEFTQARGSSPLDPYELVFEGSPVHEAWIHFDKAPVSDFKQPVFFDVPPSPRSGYRIALEMYFEQPGGKLYVHQCSIEPRMGLLGDYVLRATIWNGYKPSQSVEVSADYRHEYHIVGKMVNGGWAIQLLDATVNTSIDMGMVPVPSALSWYNRKILRYWPDCKVYCKLDRMTVTFGDASSTTSTSNTDAHGQLGSWCACPEWAKNSPARASKTGKGLTVSIQ